MQKPEMIMFDWGGTLAKGTFDGVNGTQALLDVARDNKGCSAVEIQKFADDMNKDFGREFNYNVTDTVTEVHQYPFNRYLYEYFGVDLGLSDYEVEKIFWDNSHSICNTDGIEEFLDFLYKEGIRTAVISNISFSGKILTEYINKYLPNNHFEFVLASSDYVYRKPHNRIFELALRKAGLSAENVWYCGDNVHCDVMGSFNAGITPVWYCGALHGHQNEPEIECIRVDSWKKLSDILGSYCKILEKV